MWVTTGSVEVARVVVATATVVVATSLTYTSVPRDAVFWKKLAPSPNTQYKNKEKTSRETTNGFMRSQQGEQVADFQFLGDARYELLSSEDQVY